MEIRIYDAAGELVRVLTGLAGTDVVLGIGFSSAALGSAGGSSVETVEIFNQGSGQTLASWNGRDQGGARVSPGQYQVVVRSLVAGEAPVVVSALLTVLPFDDPGTILAINPNPALDSAFFDFSGAQGGDWSLRVYTVSAELVWRAEVPGPNSLLSWDLKASDGQKIAAGLYLVLAEPKGSGRAERRVGRLVVLR